MTVLLDRARRRFADAYGGTPDVEARAPGRVNLIGEHTDYNEGFVLPMAISGQTIVLAKERADRMCRVIADDFGGAEDSFCLDDRPAHNAAAPWSDYVRGMVFAMAADCPQLRGADLVIAGDVPRGAGLSSSASLMVALGTALAGLLPPHALTANQIARMAQAAESDFVGTRCGIMDQLVSARAVAGHALLIDCRTLDCRPIPVPPDIAMMIVHSGVERGLVEGAYNDRRMECEAAARALGVTALRDASLGELIGASRQIAPLIVKRARHVISENARTLAAADALAGGELGTLGQLMAASHQSMRDDFEITVPAVDALVELLQQAIGSDGGARMTGGGFGGAVVALLPAAQVDRVREAVMAGYQTPAGTSPLILVERPCAGAAWL